MKLNLFIGLGILLCGNLAKALRCYKYADDGDDMCVAYEDCTDKSEIITCIGGNDTCGWGVEAKRNSVKGNCAARSEIDADDLALCGDKDDNGKLVDDQVCLCETDLCNALWKNTATVTSGAIMALV